MDDSYKNIFEQINDLVENIELDINKKENLEKLEKLILQNKNRTDLFFDALKSLDAKENKNILDFLKGIKILLRNWSTEGFNPLENSPKENLNDLQNLEKELENSFKSYLEYHKQKLKDIG
jgi:hypothetical protein